jgi:hypothetical protein
VNRRPWPYPISIGLVAAVLAGCATVPSTTSTAPPPATVEAIGDTGLHRLTLTPEAVRRLAIRTAPVSVGPDGRLVVPYAALMYQPDGSTFVYTNPEGTSYVRHPVEVAGIAADQVVVTSGPPAGTAVVVVGAAELWGTEFKVGKY